MSKVQNVAVVTGANRGIGRSTAIYFAEKGYRVVLVGRQKQELGLLADHLKQQFGTDTLVCAGDLEDATFWRVVVNETMKTWERIDVFVNNAAWRRVETMRSISLSNWKKTLRICLTAPAFLARYAAEAMEEKKIQGVIINVSSVMSQRAGGYSPAYMACKGGIESLTYELAALYGPKGIRVVCVNPGNVATDMSSDYSDAKGNNVSKELTEDMNNMTPLKRPGTADEIAAVIGWLASPEASFITGTTILADGGFGHNFNSYKMKNLQFPGEF